MKRQELEKAERHRRRLAELAEQKGREEERKQLQFLREQEVNFRTRVLTYNLFLSL